MRHAVAVSWRARDARHGDRAGRARRDPRRPPTAGPRHRQPDRQRPAPTAAASLEITITDANLPDEPLTHVQIGVEDHGPGVPVEERALIFERFARGVTAGRRSGSEGAGLGLALVDEHVRMHGGRVWVEDRRDGTPGARFVIELPRRAATVDEVDDAASGPDDDDRTDE